MESSENLLQQVQVTPELSLSKAFADHWEEIEKTCLESIHIEATPTENLEIAQSKFGGQPWLPEDYDYPLDGEGNPMFLLAQLNFDEIPALEGYPTTGILQFYISTSDSFIYGLDINNKRNDGHCVIYFEDTKSVKPKTITPIEWDDEALENVPLSKSHMLQFHKAKEYVGLGDVRYDSYGSFNIDDWIGKLPAALEKDLETEAYEKFCYPGHKVGGYAYFTQSDPREEDQMILLFQMDSDKEILWGDVGVGNFFIHPEDLKNKNFSNVMFNWDCC